MKVIKVQGTIREGWYYALQLEETVDWSGAPIILKMSEDQYPTMKDGKPNHEAARRILENM